MAQAAVALAFWWLELATVHALMIGVIAAESAVVVVFVVASALAIDVTIAAQILLGVTFHR